MVEYRPCGGCRAKTPRERCIGCMHSFFDGDWPEKHGTSNPKEAVEKNAPYEEWGF